MIIPLGNDIRAEVISSVLGQLSDGIWENSGRMDKYWKFADVDGTNLDISDKMYDYGYGGYLSTKNGFYDKTEKDVRDWFANKAKQVVKIWADDYGKDPKTVWNRNNTEDVVTYMGHHKVPKITVADVYECYDYLKNRTRARKEVAPETPASVESKAPKTSGGMNPSQQDLEDFFLDASTNVRRRGYVRASYAKDITAFGKCIGYGIDYHNMHTAIHGILVYSDRSEAEDFYDDIKQAERAEDEHEYNDIVDTAFSCAVEDLDEINYRDYVETGSDKIYPMYDDEFIILVNRIAVDLYM